MKDSCKRKDELKLQGNKAFEFEDYDVAILLYSMALKFDDTDATLYSNRSICWLHLGDGDEALSDAQACTRAWPDWEKGYYRQGMVPRLLEVIIALLFAHEKLRFSYQTLPSLDMPSRHIRNMYSYVFSGVSIRRHLVC